MVDHFLVLTASTKLKHSYHLIYTNTLIRFDSPNTILQFIITVLQHCVVFLSTHSYVQQVVDSDEINDKILRDNGLIYLQNILTDNNLCDCIIPETNIACQDFQKLLQKSIIVCNLSSFIHFRFLFSFRVEVVSASDRRFHRFRSLTEAMTLVHVRPNRS